MLPGAVAGKSFIFHSEDAACSKQQYCSGWKVTSKDYRITELDNSPPKTGMFLHAPSIGDPQP
eukprot:1152047-Pelagomonas_calceolata.AAC.2